MLVRNALQHGSSKGAFLPIATNTAPAADWNLTLDKLELKKTILSCINFKSDSQIEELEKICDARVQ